MASEASKGKVTAPSKTVTGGVADARVLYPWERGHSDFNAQRTNWILKNTFGSKFNRAYLKDSSGMSAAEAKEWQRRWDKGSLAYDAYLASQAPPPVEEKPPTTGGSVPSGSWLWGGGKRPTKEKEVIKREMEQARMRRFQSLQPYLRSDWAGSLPATAPSSGGMRVADKTNWTKDQAARAINKWNEFQRRRSAAMAGNVGQVNDATQRGQSTPSRANLLTAQQPNLRQSVWGAEGGNLNAALMSNRQPYAGPKG